MVRRFTAVKSLKKQLKRVKKSGIKLGFVPTMGALHEGHMSLINKSLSQTHKTLCSIFVNPTQFNDASDLKNYPRPLKNDRSLLNNTECHFLFTPSVKEIYPNDYINNWQLDLKGLDTRLEGKFRPGHFSGVVQVVKRLLDIVEPDKLYMGQKDFQQFTIINHMIKTLRINTELVVCPIIREKNGLAMSSRNRRLSPENRENAGVIYRCLENCISKAVNMDLNKIVTDSLDKLNMSGFVPEYFSIIDGFTLEEITDYSAHDYVVACTAVWIENVRLIDNVILKNETF